jgi:hypothetical protein
MPDRDPRIDTMMAWLSSVGSSEMMPPEQLERAAIECLEEIDQQSPDGTIRRLQRDLVEAYAGEGPWNLDRARMITTEIMELGTLQGALKAAFRNDELDGGWKAALDHPLYIQAEERIVSLREELRGLI